jgi:imidazolonepropionase-like amidohydrolase
MNAVVFRNARILDGTGATPFRADVRVVGHRIAAIARDPSPPATDDALIVECAGATLMPGLVEPHAHLSFVASRSR